MSVPVHPLPARPALHALLCTILLPSLALGQNGGLGQNGAAPRPEAFQLGIGMQQRGLHEEAAKYLGRFVKEQRQHALVPEAYYRLAQSRIELRQADQAIQALEQAVERGGKQFTLRAESLYRLGNLLQAKGDNQNALKKFAKLRAEIADGKAAGGAPGASAGEAHYLAAAAAYAAGEALRDLGKDADAAAAFAEAAELAVGKQAGFLFPSLYQAGFACLRLQRFDQAAKAFTAAYRSAPDDAAKGECLYLVGDSRLRLEQFEAADEAFLAAVRLGGEFADDAQYGLGFSALGRNDRDDAVANFGELLKEHPGSEFCDGARLERARCFYQGKDFDQALRELKPLLRDGCSLQQDARELQGLCALASGAGATAVETLQQALAKASDEDRPRLQFALGEALSNLERWQEALAAYRAVGGKAGAEQLAAGLRGDALYGACHALHELGKHKESIQTAQQVLAIEPAHRSRQLAQMAIAENQFALRQFEAAEAAYAALTKHEVHGRVALWKLSWCRYLRGDKGASAELFARVANDEQDGNAEEAMAMLALALYEAKDADRALQTADRYRARYREGRFLDRTERIAARVLQKRGELGAAQRRLQRAAAIAAAQGGKEAARADIAEQADLAYQQGDYNAADELFAQLTDEQGDTGARALAGRAWCAFELGDDDACLACLQVAKAHPSVQAELAGLLELESALHHRRKDWPKAVQAASAFLKDYGSHSKAPMLQYALGVAQARAGDQQGARRTLSQLAKSGSYAEQDRVFYELAWAARRDGDEPAALANFRKVAASSSDAEIAGESSLFVGTALLKAEPARLDEARKWLEKVAGSHQKQALYRLGFAEFSLARSRAAGLAGVAKGAASGKGKPDRQLLTRARDHFAAIANLPGEELLGEALYLGAECCRLLGDHADAVQRARRLLRDLPQHERGPRAQLVIGECSLLADRANDAIAPLETFLRGHDASKDAVARADAARANLWLGKARLRRRQHDQAERCFAAVTELSQGSLAAEAQFCLGQSRAGRNDLNGAADAFLKLPILYADAVWVRRGLLQAGLTYQRLKQPDKALRCFDELVEKHKGSDEAKAAQAAKTKRNNR